MILGYEWRYPLVICNITMERSTSMLLMEDSLCRWPCSRPTVKLPEGINNDKNIFLNRWIYTYIYILGLSLSIFWGMKTMNWNGKYVMERYHVVVHLRYLYTTTMVTRKELFLFSWGARNSMKFVHTVDEEILHQLIGGKKPLIYRFSTYFRHPSGGAGFC